MPSNRLQDRSQHAGGMRILYLSNARLPTEKAHGLQIMKTCEALAGAGHTVELVVPKRRNSITDDPFSYYAVKRVFALTTLFTLDVKAGRIGFLVQEITFAVAAALYLRGRDDVVYSRDEVLLWVLSFFGFRRMVWESHLGGWNLCARSLARSSKSLVVISEGLKEFYRERGVAAERIAVIPSAIDSKQFSNPESKAAARMRLGLPADAGIALYIGRLDGWKGTDTLLAASRALPETIRVAIIGGDPQQVATLRGQYPGIIFLGYRPYSELPDNQAAADVLVVPNTGKDVISARFTSPLKLVAHMASNRPIVASDLPSIREIVGHDAALLVLPDDPKALADGIGTVLADASLGSRLARRAHERVREYSWESRALKIGRVLERL